MTATSERTRNGSQRKGGGLAGREVGYQDENGHQQSATTDATSSGQGGGEEAENHGGPVGSIQRQQRFVRANHLVRVWPGTLAGSRVDADARIRACTAGKDLAI